MDTPESVLKERMRRYGGFEANAQNLRILERLEVRTADRKVPGLNLSRATLDAILKYKRPYSTVNKKRPIEDWKFFYDDDTEIVRFACSGTPRFGLSSFECQIMDWADDIAYSTHDLEDGIKVGMITESKISSKIEANVRERVERKEMQWDVQIWDNVCGQIDQVSRKFDSEYERKGERRDTIRRLIDRFITSTCAKKRERAPSLSRYAYNLVPDPKVKLECNMLKSLVWELIINDERVSTLQRKAVNIVNRLFDEFTEFDVDSRTMEMYPGDFREKLSGTQSKGERNRIACDFIAGMTDAYAARMYSRITEGESGSLFDII